VRGHRLTAAGLQLSAVGRDIAQDGSSEAPEAVKFASRRAVLPLSDRDRGGVRGAG